jgi:hypothetical protein
VRDSSAEYKQLTCEAQQFSDLLQNFRDLVARVKLTGSQFAQLVEHEKTSQQLLDSINKVLDKYQSLDGESEASKVSQKLMWSNDMANDLRTRITSHLCMLQAFYVSISQCAVLDALEWMKLHVQTGKTRCPSVATLSQASVHEDDENVDADWSELINDLENLGITSHMIKTHRDLVLRYLENAIAHGELPFRGSCASLYSDPLEVYQDDVQDVIKWMARPSRDPNFVGDALDNPVTVECIANLRPKEPNLFPASLFQEHAPAIVSNHDLASVSLDESPTGLKVIGDGTTTAR